MRKGISILLLTGLFLSTSPAWAWGRRGHALVCVSAAYLAAEEPTGGFLKYHSFDLEYYCNVPDFVWHEPSIFKQESPNHYIDLEVFERALRGSQVEKPYELTRDEFNRKFPEIPVEAGRLWWRVREMRSELMRIHGRLMMKDVGNEEKRALQGQWLLLQGTMGHYIGDLSQPLHLTENFDGQFTGQKGLHSYFEDLMVNELYHRKGFDLDAEVFHAAQKRWKKDKDKLAKMSDLELMEAESAESLVRLQKLLTIDRKIGRTNLERSMAAYKPMIVELLAAGAAYEAEFLRRALGFEFDNNRFFIFFGTPKWIAPSH